MRKLTLAFALGTFSIVVVGCSSAPEPRSQGSRDPVAVAKVTSTSSTQKLTKATTWRIYGGQTQVVIMGFGSNKKPIDGMRVRINPNAKEPTDKWLSLESLKKSGGVMELGLNNRVLIDTTTPEDKKIFHGALRAAAAYAKKKNAGIASAPKTSSDKGADDHLSAKSRLIAFADDPCALAVVMSTVASCSGQRPACKKDPKGTLMCGITSVQCASDANKAMVECAKKAKAAGGAAETTKNPPPKKATSSALPKLPSIPGSTGASSGTSAGGKGASTGSAGSKSGGQKSSGGGKGGECEENPEDCDDEPPSCEEDGSCEDDPENPEGLEDDEMNNEDEGVEDEDFNDGELDDEGELGEFDDDVDADPFGDGDFADEDFGDFDDGGGDFGDFEGGGGDFESFSPKLQSVTTSTTTSSASCGRSRVLQCGSRSSATFCRCVSR